MLTIDRILEETGALLEGHFKLTSGLHSDRYIDKMKILQYPLYTQWIANEMAKPFADDEIDVVIGPAMGGIILAYEVAKVLNKIAFFTNRDKEGKMVLRKSFDLKVGAKVLVVEDIVTTGGSVFEVLKLLKEKEVIVKGVSLIIDRSGGEVDFGVKTNALKRLKVEAFDPEDCPLCKKGIDFTVLGSTGK